MNKRLFLLFFVGSSIFTNADEFIPPSAPGTIAPWFTGTLLAPNGEVFPVGHYWIQPYFEFNTNTGKYNRHWHDASTPNFFSYTTLLDLNFGLTEWMDIEVFPAVQYNHTEGRSAWRFADFPVLVGFQLLSSEKYKYFPGIQLQLAESFPTGKYQKLGSRQLGADISGNGSFATTSSLIFYKIHHLHGFHFMSMTASFGYTYYAPVHVRGHNFYGGGHGCAGKVYPGNSYEAILSFEFSLDRHWALALDNVYTHVDRDRFRGTVGIGDKVGRPSSESLSFAPAIEYNFNQNWGIIAGVWLSAIGRNSFIFRNAIVSFIYQY
jgi:hypothetical protein